MDTAYDIVQTLQDLIIKHGGNKILTVDIVNTLKEKEQTEYTVLSKNIFYNSDSRAITIIL